MRHINNFKNNTGAVSRSVMILLASLLLLTAVCPTAPVSYASVSDDLIANSTNRTPLKDVPAFSPDCVTDQLHWVEDTGAVGEALKPFYDATGVQPYVLLKAYDATLSSETQKERWAKEYYNSNIKTENGFLFVYFAEKNQDVDVGYMCYVNGLNTSTVMDSGAMDIFWQYIDRYWYTDLSTDDVIAKAFNNTARSIMMPTFDIFGVISTLLIIAVLVLILIFTIRIINVNRQAKRRQEARARRYDREKQNRSSTIRSGLMPFDDTDYSGKKH